MKRVIRDARDLVRAVETARRSDGVTEAVFAEIPQPQEGRISKAHNLKQEREFLPLYVTDPIDKRSRRRCEHFKEYGNDHHSLTYFRGNQNIPRAIDPILDELRALDVIRAVSKDDTNSRRGDELGLEWKLTLNLYKARTDDGGGALFPWHTDLPANGEITAIVTLLAPAILEFAPYSDLSAADRPTRIVAEPGSLMLLSGAARWKWVHRAVPHPDAIGKERISLVLGCAPV